MTTEEQTVKPVAEQIARTLGALDVDTLRARYLEQDEFLLLPQVLPSPVVAELVGEVERLRPAVHRNFIPKHKKGGSVSYYTLLAEAPATLTLYRSPAFQRLLESLTGRPLMRCPDTDPHACALYFYTEPGDHIGFHYDTSYYRGTRFTILLGLIERSSSRLVCKLYTRTPGREPVELKIATEPGTMVIFNGDKLWHAITPLGDDEERVSLTMEFVTDQSMSPVKRFVSNMKDAIAYFGFRAVFTPGGRATARR